MHEMITRSPTWTVDTAEPVSTTVPTPSWPRMRPGVTAGTSPLRMCRSVPQIVVVSVRTMMSVGSTMTGSGTSSQAFWPGPWYTSAFMVTTSSVAGWSTRHRVGPGRFESSGVSPRGGRGQRPARRGTGPEAKADHDVVEQELELETDTELTRLMEGLVSEMHARLMSQPPTDGRSWLLPEPLVGGTMDRWSRRTRPPSTARRRCWWSGPALPAW